MEVTEEIQIGTDGIAEADQKDLIAIEKAEELKLKGKYPQLKTASQFCHQRLKQKPKFFDSGDYNVQLQIKAKTAKLPSPPVKPSAPEPDRLKSPDCENLMEMEVGTEIPTPETIPLRKTSMINAEVASKLSPQAHVHHSPISPLTVMDPYNFPPT